jgi:hypothetical protein
MPDMSILKRSNLFQYNARGLLRTVDRLLDLIEQFLSTVKWLEHNVTFVATNIEMDLRFITWIDHEHGATFTPQVSQT